MASIDLTEKIAVYKEGDESRVLLDFTKYLTNKSRISMHREPGRNVQTLPELLAGIFAKEKENGDRLCLPTLLLDTLLAARLIQTSQPVRVLEYGCKDGSFSWHIAELLGRFHPESSMVCAYHAMDEDWIKWMERVCQVQWPPKISYISGEYGHLQLQKDYFDIVLINGMMNFTEPEQVILDALSLATKDGILLCYAEEAPLLEAMFKLYFEKREEYNLTSFQKVLTAKASDQSWREAMCACDVIEQARTDLEEARCLSTGEEANREVLADMIQRLQEDTWNAARLGEVELKIRLIEVKERLVDLMVCCLKGDLGHQTIH